MRWQSGNHTVCMLTVCNRLSALFRVFIRYVFVIKAKRLCISPFKLIYLQTSAPGVLPATETFWHVSVARCSLQLQDKLYYKL